MITTRGFRDLIYIGRHRRPKTFSIYQDLPWREPTLVERRLRLPVTERMVPPGEVHTPLDEDEVREAVRSCARRRSRRCASASCSRSSTRSTSGGSRRSSTEELPEAHLSISHEVTPQHREYERFSTTALNAYIGPKTSRYLRRMHDALHELAPRHRLPPHGLQRRHADRRGRGRAPDAAADVRPGGRDHRRHRGRASGGLRQRDHARRGRHLGGHRRGARRAAADEAPLRHQPRRLRRDGVDGGSRHDRRRRRLDRPHRRGRPAARRAAERRAPTRGRSATTPAARSRRPPTRRRRSAGCAPRRGSRAASSWTWTRPGRDGEARARARHGCRGGRARRDADRDPEHGQRDQHQLGAARLRPARLQPRRLRRRRPAVRRRHRARAVDPARDRPAPSRHHLGHGAARVRPQVRDPAHRDGRGRRRPTPPRSRPSSRRWRPRAGSTSTSDGIDEGGRVFQRLADCRYIGQAYELLVHAAARAARRRGHRPRGRGVRGHPRARVLLPLRGPGADRAPALLRDRADARRER